MVRVGSAHHVFTSDQLAANYREMRREGFEAGWICSENRVKHPHTLTMEECLFNHEARRGGE